jgi:hypothetical protein
MAATNLVARDEQHVATMVRFALRMRQEAAQVRGGLPLGPVCWGLALAAAAGLLAGRSLGA